MVFFFFITYSFYVLVLTTSPWKEKLRRAGWFFIFLTFCLCFLFLSHNGHKPDCYFFFLSSAFWHHSEILWKHLTKYNEFLQLSTFYSCFGITAIFVVKLSLVIAVGIRWYPAAQLMPFHFLNCFIHNDCESNSVIKITLTFVGCCFIGFWILRWFFS